MFFADGLKRSFSSAFSTHPPLRDRILKIQPNWDGKVEKAKEPVAREKPKPATEATAAGGAFSDRTGMGKIQGMVILGAIGTISDSRLDRARTITNSIPEAFDEKLRQSSGARHGLLALVMADNPDDDARQWDIVRGASREDEVAEIEAAYGIVAGLPREARLGILELAATTLAQSSEPVDDSFLKLLDELILADRKTSIYEFCLRRILRLRLGRNVPGPARSESVNYMQIDGAVADALGVILSAVAREVCQASSPSALLERAVRTQYLLNGKVQYREADSNMIHEIDEALDVLRSTAFAIRAQLLRAVVACMREDGQLTADEAEFLRMLGLSLECPVPPLG